jgi:hypothetical protein
MQVAVAPSNTFSHEPPVQTKDGDVQDLPAEALAASDSDVTCLPFNLSA